MVEQLIIHLSDWQWANAKDIKAVEGINLYDGMSEKKESGHAISSLTSDTSEAFLGFNPQVRWWVVKGEQIVEGPHLAYFHALRENLDERYLRLPLVLLVNGEWVTQATAEVPAKSYKQMRQAAPYALEDLLSEEIESLHFAFDEKKKSKTSKINVLVIDKVLLKTWLYFFQSMNFFPVAMLPDTLLVSCAPDLLTLILEEERAFVVTPLGRRMVFHASQIAIFLQDVWAENTEMLAEKNIRIRLIYQKNDPKAKRILDLVSEEIQKQKQEILFSLEECPLNQPVFSFLLTQPEVVTMLLRPPIQLLQGEFRPRARSKVSLNEFKYSFVACTVFLCLLFSFWTGQIIYYQSQTIKLANESEALFRSLFPEENKIIDLKRQFSTKLNQLNRQTEKSVSFIQLMNEAGESIQAQKNSDLSRMIRLSRVIFDGDQQLLRLELEVEDFPMIDQLKSKMELKGLTVSVDAANKEAEFVKARLKISKVQG